VRDDVKRIEDLATLRALAHPLRMRLLAALRIDGPATASELGRRFDETSGATSYHLRQLARYGFVEEAPDQPSRRERVWRAVHESTAWNTAEFLGDPAGRAAMRVFERRRLDTLTDAIGRWYAERLHWPKEWVAASIDSDVIFRLRRADLEDLQEDLRALYDKYDARRRSPDDPEAERIVLFVQGFPAREVDL
jgi:DNA-binding transcriptional ArsR family regulator